MKNKIIYEDFSLYVEKEESEIPWLKIFTKEPYKELGDVPAGLRTKLWETYDLIEYEMRHYYNPKKINMASFANILPRVHIHIMARFEEDSYFPQSMWGEKQRDVNLNLPNEDEFHKRVFNALTQKHN
ncbi:HIT domain-containing protein [Sulfurimonas sp. SAG-AH-194-C20]|nr:HIT domain-containing protein [Sulfurimonas sp. SAG-AH-194-C20]MDF1878327.1 HIT domain-containing protein [Sulfurimonas sp. SAG-AH-194-C20]